MPAILAPVQDHVLDLADIQGEAVSTSLLLENVARWDRRKSALRYYVL